jgi:hypothetical protein
MGDLPFSEEYRREIADNAAYAHGFTTLSKAPQGALEEGPVAD